MYWIHVTCRPLWSYKIVPCKLSHNKLRSICINFHMAYKSKPFPDNIHTTSKYTEKLTNGTLHLPPVLLNFGFTLSSPCPSHERHTIQTWNLIPEWLGLQTPTNVCNCQATKTLKITSQCRWSPRVPLEIQTAGTFSWNFSVQTKAFWILPFTSATPLP